MINYSQSIKISQLDELANGSITPDDFIAIVDSGSLTTKRVSLLNLKAEVFGGGLGNVGGDTCIIYESGSALTGSNNLKFDYNTNILYVTNSINTYSVTASLYGTSSWAISSSNSRTASYIKSTNIDGLLVATSASYLSGSTGILNNLYVAVDGQKSGPFNYNSATNNGIYLVSTSSANPAYSQIYLAASSSKSGNDNTDKVGIWINGAYTSSPTNYLPIYLGGNSDNATPTAKVTINSSGNVGIGTMNPQSKLHVDGNILLSGYLTNTGSIPANSNFVGNHAGENWVVGTIYPTSSPQNSNFFGQYAGYQSTGSSDSNFLGQYAGAASQNSWNCNFLGSNAGNGATQCEGSNFLGMFAGQNALEANNLTAIGYSAGLNSKGLHHTILLCMKSGENASSSYHSNFQGYSAGANSFSSSNSNFFGYYAGYNTYKATNSNFLGTNAGFATSASNSNFLGYDAGSSASKANNSNFIGQSSGFSASNASYSNFIGYNAGKQSPNANNSIFIGNYAGYTDSVKNSFNVGDGSSGSSILIGDYTSTAGYPNGISIGKGTRNFASGSLNIGNVIYARNIYSGSAGSSTPVVGGKVGIGTNNPQNALDVVGNISCSAITASNFSFPTVKAAVSFNGNGPVITSSYNIQSVTRASSGIYTINFANAINTSSCWWTGTVTDLPIGNLTPIIGINSTYPINTGSISIRTNGGGGSSNDYDFVTVVIHGY